MVRKGVRVNQGDLPMDETRVHAPSAEELESAGVRASIVAKKYRNGYGAKGCRKVEVQNTDDATKTSGSAYRG